MFEVEKSISVSIRPAKSEAETGESCWSGKPGSRIGELLKPGPTIKDVDGGKRETLEV